VKEWGVGWSWLLVGWSSLSGEGGGQVGRCGCWGVVLGEGAGWRILYYLANVRGHPSISLPTLCSPALPLFIYSPSSPLYHLQGLHL
jgi:hypothetical protein